MHVPSVVLVLISLKVMVGVLSQLSVAVGVAGAGTASHSTVVSVGQPANTGAVVSWTRLPHRTLIIHGREDQVIPVQTSLRLEELIDNADLSVYSHCGHWSMIERNADFNRSLLEFLSS